MPRARNIKPSFFDSSLLGKLDDSARLLYIALSTMADREGIIRYDVDEIRRYAFGYKPNITADDVHRYITVISRLGNNELLRVVNYDGRDYILMTTFLEEQNPHHTEKKGGLPSLNLLNNLHVNGDITVTSPLSNGSILIPDSLIPDSIKLSPPSLVAEMSQSERPEPESTTENIAIQKVKGKRVVYPIDFEEFWSIYPKKCEKPNALKHWKAAINLATPEQIIDGAKRYSNCKSVTDGYACFPAKWLKNQRWNDQFENQNAQAQPPEPGPSKRAPDGRIKARFIPKEQWDIHEHSFNLADPVEAEWLKQAKAKEFEQKFGNSNG